MSNGQLRLTARQAHAVTRIAGLTVVNALVFQEMLAEHDSRVDPLRRTLEQGDVITAFSEHWRHIVEDINYVPIFRVAREVLLSLASTPDVDSAVRELADGALKIVRERAALRHDLMGRIYHLLLEEAKYLGTYYTSVPSATLLLKVALERTHWQTDWSDLPQVSANFRVADLACGTGTLLMAAAEAITDNYVRDSVERGKELDFRGLHRTLIENVIHGYDVLPSALHLTASTLAIRAPEVSFEGMRLYSLPLGGPHHRLGSIEFLRSRDMPISVDLFGFQATAEQVTGRGDVSQNIASVPDLDLCVMNPPFTRSVGGNLLFGSLPEEERRPMQTELARLVRSPEVYASSTAGLGSVFVAVGDKYIKTGGRLALVLPKALLSGVAWNETRMLIRQRYQLEYVIASHDPARWNFSDNTDLSEVLVVARKIGDRAEHEAVGDVICLNLWHNPKTAFEALAVAHALVDGTAADIETGQGALDICVGDSKFGEAVRMPWRELREGAWMLPSAFAQSDLTRAAFHLARGAVCIPGSDPAGDIPLCTLGNLGVIGPDRRDIHDGFRLSRSHTAYPAFWGHDAESVLTISQAPNRYLAPLSAALKGRPLRRSADLWPRAGRVMLAERLWLKTQRSPAIRLSEPALSNVWWPFNADRLTPEAEKSLVLWLNSTPGLLILLAHRVETRGAWVDFKKPILTEMGVLDVTALGGSELARLSAEYNRLCGETLSPFPEMGHDPVRAEIDAAVAEVLGLPRFDVLRQMLGREPVVCLQPLS